MRQSDGEMDRTWLDDNVEVYLDGELEGADRERFEAALASDVDLRASVEAAVRIRETLAAIEMPPCPDSVVSEVLSHAARERSRDRGVERYLEALLRPRRRSWGLAMAVAGVLALVTVSTVLMRDSDSSTEVDQGLADVKLALAYVGIAGRHAGDIVRMEVVHQGMIAPMRRAVRRVSPESELPAADRVTPAAQQNRDNEREDEQN